MGNSYSEPKKEIVEIYSKSFLNKPTQLNSQKNFFYNNIQWTQDQPITQDHTIMY